MICCPLSFELVVDNLEPLLVQVAPNGAAREQLLPGWSWLAGYQDVEEPPIDDLDEWWWKAVYSEELRGVGLADRMANIAIATEYAPLAKLFLAGRRHRVVVGEELIRAEAILQRHTTVTIDPYFAARTDHVSSSELLFYLTESDTLRCDWCNAEVAKEGSSVLSPWALRDERVGRLAIEKLGGGRRGYLNLIRDWSTWLVCLGCLTEINVS